VRIDEILRSRKPCFSFEFFPPQSDEGVARLLSTVEVLRPLEPAFVSVTYGAGGSTRARTIEVTKAIKRDLGVEAMAHLTCVGADVAGLRAVLDEVASSGIDNLLALRGDPPGGHGPFVAPPGGLAHATDLMALVSRDYDFCVGGACYPEMHLESKDAAVEMRHALLKVEAGAKFLITQLFFDNERYFAFVERARRAGISVPIIPGIMPITNADQIARFTSRCGATIPAALRAALDVRKDEPEAVLDLGVAYATLQCVDLLARGVPAIHFYTLNKSPATRAVVSALLAARPWEPARGRRYLDDEGTTVEHAMSLSTEPPVI
jgi:methylenetetrahydrofolate reductase (NADPH)